MLTYTYFLGYFQLVESAKCPVYSWLSRCTSERDVRDHSILTAATIAAVYDDHLISVRVSNCWRPRDSTSCVAAVLETCCTETRRRKYMHTILWAAGHGPRIRFQRGQIIAWPSSVYTTSCDRYGGKLVYIDDCGREAQRFFILSTIH